MLNINDNMWREASGGPAGWATNGEKSGTLSISGCSAFSNKADKRPLLFSQSSRWQGHGGGLVVSAVRSYPSGLSSIPSAPASSEKNFFREPA